MNVVDSSGWLEFFSAGPNADAFSEPILDLTSLIVPVVTIYEVCKVVLRESAESEALQAVAAMQKGKVIDMTAGIAINASKISLQHDLPMADSIILATARVYDCVVWTQDSHFEHLSGVKFFPKR